MCVVGGGGGGGFMHCTCKVNCVHREHHCGVNMPVMLMFL